MTRALQISVDAASAASRQQAADLDAAERAAKKLTATFQKKVRRLRTGPELALSKKAYEEAVQARTDAEAQQIAEASGAEGPLPEVKTWMAEKATTERQWAELWPALMRVTEAAYEVSTHLTMLSRAKRPKSKVRSAWQESMEEKQHFAVLELRQALGNPAVARSGTGTPEIDWTEFDITKADHNTVVKVVLAGFEKLLERASEVCLMETAEIDAERFAHEPLELIEDDALRSAFEACVERAHQGMMNVPGAEYRLRLVGEIESRKNVYDAVKEAWDATCFGEPDSLDPELDRARAMFLAGTPALDGTPEGRDEMLESVVARVDATASGSVRRAIENGDAGKVLSGLA